MLPPPTWPLLGHSGQPRRPPCGHVAGSKANPPWLEKANVNPAKVGRVLAQPPNSPAVLQSAVFECDYGCKLVIFFESYIEQYHVAELLLKEFDTSSDWW